MSSKSETGIAVNNANLSKVRSKCENMGDAYTPPNDAIGIVNIKAKEVSQTAAIKGLRVESAPWMIGVNGRGDAMDLVDPYTTKIKNMVMVCEVPASFKKDVTSIVKKIQGVRAVPKIKTVMGDPETPTEESIIQISASQQGFDNKLGNLETLYELLKAEPGYAPEEDDLKCPAIKAVIDDLHARNDDVIDLTPPVESARMLRNHEMFDIETGGNALAAMVKNYFKAKWGGNSAEYHSVGKIEFTPLGK